MVSDKLFPVSILEENTTADEIWNNNSDGSVKNRVESDSISTLDAQTDEGLIAWLYVCFSLLLNSLKPLPSKKRGCNPGKRIPPDKKTKLNTSTLFLCVGLLSLPILPAKAAAAHKETPLTLRAGANGVIPFNLSVKDNLNASNVYYTVRFEAKDRPFCVDGYFDPEGFISPDQSQRFSTKLNVDIDTLTVDIDIANVSADAEGTYELLTLYNFGSRNIETHLMTKIVKVYVPPRPARCYFKDVMDFERFSNERFLHCHFEPGNGNSTLTCLQNGENIPYIGPKEVVTSRTFLVMNEKSPVVCCSHELGEEVNSDTCGQQFRYPRSHVETTTVYPKTQSKEGSVVMVVEPTEAALPKVTKRPVVGGSGSVLSSSLFSTIIPLMVALLCI